MTTNAKQPKCKYHGDACPFAQNGDTELVRLRIAIDAIFTEYDKPSTTKTYPGQKTRVRRGVAIDEILALFQPYGIGLIKDHKPSQEYLDDSVELSND